MSKIIDITDKLNFEEKPKIKIKDKEFAVNNSAATILKVMPLLEEEGSPTTINKAFNLLFDKKTQEEIMNLENLSFEDFSTIILSAVKLVAGNNDEGEGLTPATT